MAYARSRSDAIVRTSNSSSVYSTEIVPAFPKDEGNIERISDSRDSKVITSRSGAKTRKVPPQSNLKRIEAILPTTARNVQGSVPMPWAVNRSLGAAAVVAGAVYAAGWRGGTGRDGLRWLVERDWVRLSLWVKRRPVARGALESHDQRWTHWPNPPKSSKSSPQFWYRFGY